MNGRSLSEMLKISQDNLRRLELDFSAGLEAGRAHLRELAHTVTADRPGVELLLERLSTGRIHAVPYDALKENETFLNTVFAHLSAIEQIELCRLVCAEMPTLSFTALVPHDDPLPRGAQGLIAYLRNAFTDRAYRVFSAAMPRARSAYHDSYGSACEAVSTGSCEACILPIEHTLDGKLLGFYRLIDRYELKIACTCDLDQQDGTVSRFALLKKSMTSPAESGERFFEFSLTRSTENSIGLLLDAAALCGLSLRRIDSIPLAYSEDRFAYHAVYARAEETALVPFMLYLSLAAPQYNPIGLYTHISE